MNIDHTTTISHMNDNEINLLNRVWLADADAAVAAREAREAMYSADIALYTVTIVPGKKPSEIVAASDAYTAAKFASEQADVKARDTYRFAVQYQQALIKMTDHRAARNAAAEAHNAAALAYEYSLSDYYNMADMIDRTTLRSADGTTVGAA